MFSWIICIIYDVTRKFSLFEKLTDKKEVEEEEEDEQKESMHNDEHVPEPATPEEEAGEEANAKVDEVEQFNNEESVASDKLNVRELLPKGADTLSDGDYSKVNDSGVFQINL